jgi:HK97 family phage major capsid protein
MTLQAALKRNANPKLTMSDSEFQALGSELQDGYERLLDSQGSMSDAKYARKMNAMDDKYEKWSAEAGRRKKRKWNAMSQTELRQRFDAARTGHGFDTSPAASAQDRALHAWCKSQSGIPLSGDEGDALSNFGISSQSGTFSLNLPRHHPRTGQQILNAMRVGTGSAGGFTVSQGMVGSLERAMLDFSGVMQAASIMRTDNGEPLVWPTADDTGNTGVLLGEGGESTEQDVTMGAVIFSASKISSRLVKVAQELLTDSALNFATELGSILGERIGRKANQLLTTGTGAGIQPSGIVTESTLGVTAAGATAITFDELIDLQYSVDPSYRQAAPNRNVGWMMNDGIAKVIRKLKDGDSNYLWENSTQAGQPPMLLGYPVFLNQDMQSTVATGTKTVLFGDLSKYKVRTVGEVRIRRLVERYAEFDQEGFIGFYRLDGALVDGGGGAIKHLIQA